MAVEIIIITFLILLGVALLAAEVFLLPGVTVAGIAGGIMLIGSIAYAFYFMGETAGYITIAGNVVVSIAAFIYILKSNALDRIALNTDIESTIEPSEVLQLNKGQIGIALSRLNPMGKAEFDEQYIVEVKSLTGEFIDEGEHVQIVQIEKSHILVQSISSDKNKIKQNTNQ